VTGSKAPPDRGVRMQERQLGARKGVSGSGAAPPAARPGGAVSARAPSGTRAAKPKNCDGYDLEMSFTTPLTADADDTGCPVCGITVRQFALWFDIHSKWIKAATSSGLAVSTVMPE
jgi:hypothetical protein